MDTLIPQNSASLTTALAGLGQGSMTHQRGTVEGDGFQATIAIPDYPARIKERYGDLIEGTLVEMCQKASLCAPHHNFGLIIEFDDPMEIQIYDEEMVLDETLRILIAKFGTVILRNAYMPHTNREEGQRNIFPNMSFHIDRGSNQEEQYSLFCRDPFDPVQRDPRGSSTLIVGNIVCYLQKMRESGGVSSPLGAQCYIFGDGDLGLDEIMIEQAWAAPAATGEICIIDNRTVLHASYYKPNRGYPIGVRYLK